MNMRRLYLLVLVLMPALTVFARLPMGGWKIHLAYTDVMQVEQAPGKVYGLSDGALFSVDKQTEEILYYSKLTGLSSMNIVRMCYDEAGGRLLLFYANGNIDLMDDEGNVENIADLYTTQMSESKQVNDVLILDREALLAMDFGIVVINLKKEEIHDTYYIGANAAPVQLAALAADRDSVYAASANTLYSAARNSQLIDFSNWHSLTSLPGKGSITQLAVYADTLCMLRDSTLYMRTAGGWQNRSGDLRLDAFSVSGGRLMMHGGGQHVLLTADAPADTLRCHSGATDAVYDAAGRCWWFAAVGSGVGRYNADHSTAAYQPVGPSNNIPYRLRFLHDRLYMVAGGYKDLNIRRTPGAVSIYNGETWQNVSNGYFNYFTDIEAVAFCDVMPLRDDPSHYFVTSLSNGLIEMRNDAYYAWHYSVNSGLATMYEPRAEVYTWVDALMADSRNNLWMFNNTTTVNPLKMLTADGKWYAFPFAEGNGDRVRVKNILPSAKEENMLFVLRFMGESGGIYVYDHNGTYANLSDDRSAFHARFEDQRGNIIAPSRIWSGVIDLNGALWVGTNAGVLCFPTPEDLLSSNKCRRITMRRDDGTNLLDYMLDNETIEALAVDGQNRMWIGTLSSGVYLMDIQDDDAVTVAHYTTENSILPSDEIKALAINQATGEVFIGTSKGLVSYQSDAAEAAPDYGDVYAYPNPVRPDFSGVITIAGLVDNSVVKILNQAGELVCETRSNGGIVVWDGCNPQGRRVAAGVYTAVAITADASRSGTTKILIMR